MIETYDIAGYCRISVDEELDRDNVSIENQKAIIQDFVRQRFPGSTLTFYEDRDRSGYTFEQREGYQAILRCYEQGREVSLGAVAGEIGEKALNELSAAAAEYSHVSCTPQDIEMHLERIARGAPRSAQAGGMSDQELTDYIAQIRQRKGGGQTEQEE